MLVNYLKIEKAITNFKESLLNIIYYSQQILL